MSNVSQILVSAVGLAVLGVGLAGCGQRGPLYLPTDPAAANRATLPQLLLPTTPRSEEAPKESGDEKPTTNGNATGAAR